MISYRKILKQAWHTTKTNKFLWWYGLLLFFGMTINIGYGFSNDQTAKRIESANVPAIDNFINQPWSGFILIALICLWLFIYFQAKAGAILAVKMITEKQPVSFWLTFGLARNFITRLLGVSLFLQVLLGTLSIVITTPIFYLFSVGSPVRAIILAILGALVFIPVAFLVSFANVISPLFLVIFNMPVFQGIRAAISVITEAWRKLLLFSLLLAGIGILASILGAIASSPFVILAVLSYHREAQILGPVLSGLAGLVVFLSFQAVISAFQQTAWVMFFMELVKPEKIEEETVSVADSATQ